MFIFCRCHSIVTAFERVDTTVGNSNAGLSPKPRCELLRDKWLCRTVSCTVSEELFLTIIPRCDGPRHSASLLLLRHV
jgi:hypothetical protein